CCYSWCVEGRAKEAPNPPTHKLAYGGPVSRSTTCVEAPENGTTLPADEAFPECPAGLQVDANPRVGALSFDAEAPTNPRKAESGGILASHVACCYTRAHPRRMYLGRAFRPGGELRTAKPVASHAWLDGAVAGSDLSAEVRAELARVRARDAALEH